MEVDVCEKVASNFINANVVHFEFCERWDGTVKVAQFTQRKEDKKFVTYSVPIDELAGTAAMPNEVVEGDLDISAFGTDPETGMRITSTVVKIVVERSGFVEDGETPIPPTPDLYTQFVAQVHDAAVAGAPYIADDGNWVIRGENSGVKADWSAETANAAASAESAAKSAEAAAKSAEAAFFAPPIVETKFGALVSITDGAAMHAVELVSSIASSTGGQNVVTVYGCGGNLAGVVVPIGITSNTQIACNSRWRSLEIPVVPGIWYTIKRESLDTNVRFRRCFTTERASFVEGASTTCFGMTAADNFVEMTVEAPENARWMYVYLDNAGATIDLSRYVANVGQSAIAYEPYQVRTLTADLPVTVYGGALNWTTGVLTSALDANGNERAEPITIQLAPQRLDVLKGNNNVWSDTGDTVLSYVADTKLYFDERIAAIAAAAVNS